MADIGMLNLIIVAVYIAVSIAVYIVYIAAVEAANKRLSKALGWWRWYYGYAVLAISLTVVVYFFRVIDYESGIFVNLPGVLVHDQVEEFLLHRGLPAPYLLIMLTSTLLAWLSIGWVVQRIKAARRGSS